MSKFQKPNKSISSTASNSNNNIKRPFLDVKGKSSISDITWWHQIKVAMRSQFEEVADVLDSFETKEFTKIDPPPYPMFIPYLKREEVNADGLSKIEMDRLLFMNSQRESINKDIERDNAELYRRYNALLHEAEKHNDVKNTEKSLANYQLKSGAYYLKTSRFDLPEGQ